MSSTTRRFSYQPSYTQVATNPSLSRSQSYRHEDKYESKTQPGATHHTHANQMSSWPIDQHAHKYDDMIDALCDRSFTKDTPDLSVMTDHPFSVPSTYSETPSLLCQSFDSDTSGNMLPMVQTGTPYDFSAYRITLPSNTQKVGLGIQEMYKEDGTCFDGLGVLSYRDSNGSSSCTQPDEAAALFGGQVGGSVGMEWWGWSTGPAYVPASSAEQPVQHTSATNAKKYTRRHKRSESYFGNNTIHYYTEAQAITPSEATSRIASATKPNRLTRLSQSTKITPAMPTEDDVFYNSPGAGWTEFGDKSDA